MQPDDDSQTTLSKWPFIIGDVLLVATALAISILGHWQLTDWQVGACVAAVALGAALFVLPYIVEYQVRVREEREDRASDLRIFEKHLHAAEQAIDAADARIRALENAAAEAAAETDDPNDALAEAMDQKIAKQEVARAAQEEVIQALQKNLQELAAKEPLPAFDPEVLKPIEKRLKALEAKPAPEPSVPEPEKPEPKAPVSKPEQKAPQPVKSEQTAPPEPEKKAAPIERPQREARERHGPQESRLLKRAISEKGDKSSTAVSRIIESKAKGKAPVAPKEPEKIEPEPEKEESVKQEEPKKEEPKIEKPEPEPKQTEPEAKAANRPEPEPAAKEESIQEEPKPETKSETDIEAEPATAPYEPAKKEQSTPEPTPTAEVSAQADAEMLFDEDKITSPIIRTKAKKNDAVLTASVFIGIGNKPYLRGSGAGLSWEKGQLMEFQEIGKWRWVAPSDLEEPLELQIYRNDEDPDQSGKYTLEPGQKLEITPVF